MVASTYISEVYYAGNLNADFIEVAVPAGSDVTGWTVQVYDNGGAYLYSLTYPASTATISGQDVYLFDKGLPGWSNLFSGLSVALVDGTGTVQQYISLFDPPVAATSGDAAGLTPTYVGATTTSTESLQSDNDGASYYVQPAPNAGTIPCFSAGMMVACPGGARAVETLSVGDLVLTQDGRTQPICWVSKRKQVFVRADFSDRPVLVRAGTLGAVRDLIVSPQHRVLLGSRRQTAAGAGMLVPAKALTALPGIRTMRGRHSMVWHHFALDRHDIICVNGVWTESLLLGPMVLAGLPRTEALKLRGQFPSIVNGALNGPPKRPCLNVRQTYRMLRELQDDVGLPRFARASGFVPELTGRPDHHMRPGGDHVSRASARRQ